MNAKQAKSLRQVVRAGFGPDALRAPRVYTSKLMGYRTHDTGRLDATGLPVIQSIPMFTISNAVNSARRSYQVAKRHYA